MHEVVDHFGLNPHRCGTGSFADRLLAWYAAKNQEVWQQHPDILICRDEVCRNRRRRAEVVLPQALGYGPALATGQPYRTPNMLTCQRHPRPMLIVGSDH